MSADYFDVVELGKFVKHRFECDAVVIGLV